MDRTQKAIFTNMCMICDDNQNVLVQNRTDPDWPGIAFPGGHVEKGEPFTDAVIREVFEETGLTVSNLRLCGIKDWLKDDGVRYIVLLYRATAVGGTLTSSNEGEVMWVPLNKLKTMRLASSMKSLLNIFWGNEFTEQFFRHEGDEWVEYLK